jgi:hypothetical protein
VRRLHLLLERAQDRRLWRRGRAHGAGATVPQDLHVRNAAEPKYLS